MFQSVLAKLALLISSSIYYTTVRDCAVDKSLFHIDEINITPSKPVAGENVTLYVEYTVPESVTVTSGTVEYSVTYNFIPISPTYQPLCDNVECPLLPGSHSSTSVTQWPADISGALTMRMRWRDIDNQMLMCMEMAGQFWAPTNLIVQVKRRRLRAV